MPQDKFWTYDSSGNRVEVKAAYVRDGGGNLFSVSEIYMRDETGTPHKVFPTSDDPTGTSVFNDKFFTFCGLPGDRVTAVAFQSNSTPSVPSMPTEGEGLGSSIWHFQAYGYASDSWFPYGRFKWNSTAGSSGDNPFNSLDWGYIGSVVRRIPKVTSTTVVPSEYKDMLWVRPSTVDHLSLGWQTGYKAFWWNPEATTEEDIDNPYNDTRLRTLYVPRLLPASMDYFEYFSQGNRGLGGPGLFTNRDLVNCFNTQDLFGYWAMRAWDGSGTYYPTMAKFDANITTYPVGLYTDHPAGDIPTVSLGTGNNQGQWVVIEKYVTESDDNEVYCGSAANDFPCHKNTDNENFATEKEIIVALVASKVGGTGAAYNFTTDYNNDADDANFYANTTSGSASDRWFTWDGDGDVFLFIRYRASCFSQFHVDETETRVGFNPEIKEFWIQPKAWPRVSGGGAWSSNYIGMVMNTIPSVYSDPCYKAGLNQAHYNLPKYFYWNIPLDKCTSGSLPTALVGYTFLPNTSDGWAWGTPTPFYNWDNNTGRQDLIGAGASAVGWEEFDPAPNATRKPNSAETGYEFGLLDFNRKFSSVDGFPFGIGHAWGSDILSPSPWCPCTFYSFTYNLGNQQTPGDPVAPSGDYYCPCSAEWNGTNLVDANKAHKCCTASAQPTQIYLLDKTKYHTIGEWDHTTWASGVPSNIQWTQCEATGDGVCGGLGSECGDVDCPNCAEAEGYYNCNCEACCECVRQVDSFCSEFAWDIICIEYMTDPSTCRSECSNNPACQGF